MPKIKIAILLAATVGAIAVTASPAMALKAFVASERGQVKGNQTKLQVFTTKFIAIECEIVTSNGAVAEGAVSQIKQNFVYSRCTALGFPTAVPSADFLFKFSGAEGLHKGSLELQKAMTIKMEAVGCTLTILPQLFKEAVTWTNVGNNIEGIVDGTGFRYEGKGVRCEGHGENGEYKGDQIVSGNPPPVQFKVE